MGKRFFYAQGQSAASRWGELNRSPFWPHRNTMSGPNWRAFTAGFVDQSTHRIKH